MTRTKVWYWIRTRGLPDAVFFKEENWKLETSRVHAPIGKTFFFFFRPVSYCETSPVIEPCTRFLQGHATCFQGTGARLNHRSTPELRIPARRGARPTEVSIAPRAPQTGAFPPTPSTPSNPPGRRPITRPNIEMPASINALTCPVVRCAGIRTVPVVCVCKSRAVFMRPSALLAA